MVQASLRKESLGYFMRMLYGDPNLEIIDPDGLATVLPAALAELKANEWLTLELHFGLYGPKRSYREIGEAFDVSGTRVRDIQNKALRRLRHPIRCKAFRPYLKSEFA